MASPPGFPLGEEEEAVAAVDDLPWPATAGEEVEGEVVATDSKRRRIGNKDEATAVYRGRVVMVVACNNG